MALQEINDRVLGRNTWPPRAQRPVWEAIEGWAAFRRSDEQVLKQIAGVSWQRRWIITPVPKMIARAKGNLLYGEPCDVRASDERDQAHMDRICRENAIADGHSAELHRAAILASSEREVWGRVVVDETLADVPIIEFCSRRWVIPQFSGRFVIGATFVKEWHEGTRRVYRLLQHYEPGRIRSELWLGTPSLKGTELPLKDYPATEGVEPVVLTGFDRPLCAFIPNTVDGDPSAGYSDYQGLEQRFLAINEAATVAQENLILTGQKRALVDGKYTRNGKLIGGHDIWVRSDDAVTVGDAGKALQMLEYTFEADQNQLYLNDLIDTTLTFGGTAPQLAGRQVAGGAISGTAQRLKMIHSLMEAAGTGGYFDRGVQRLVRMCAIIDSRSTALGGFGRRWMEPDEDPTVVRGDGLPRDEMEAAQWLVLAHGADAISVEERVMWLHPEWGEDQVAQEVERLREERKASRPATGDAPDDDEPVTGPGLPEPGTRRGAAAAPVRERGTA